MSTLLQGVTFDYVYCEQVLLKDKLHCFV